MKTRPSDLNTNITQTQFRFKTLSSTSSWSSPDPLLQSRSPCHLCNHPFVLWLNHESWFMIHQNLWRNGFLKNVFISYGGIQTNWKRLKWFGFATFHCLKWLQHCHHVCIAPYTFCFVHSQASSSLFWFVTMETHWFMFTTPESSFSPSYLIAINRLFVKF